MEQCSLKDGGLSARFIKNIQKYTVSDDRLPRFLCCPGKGAGVWYIERMVLPTARGDHRCTLMKYRRGEVYRLYVGHSFPEFIAEFRMGRVVLGGTPEQLPLRQEDQYRRKFCLGYIEGLCRFLNIDASGLDIVHSRATLPRGVSSEHSYIDYKISRSFSQNRGCIAPATPLPEEHSAGAAGSPSASLQFEK
jgi:hypothetical protein